jgi:hypothetical protein
VTAFVIEIPGMLLHPLPPGTDLSNADAIKSHMSNAPLAALMCVALAWFTAPLVASSLAALIARRAFLLHAMLVGVFFLTMDMLNVISFPHPTWLIAVGIVAPLIAAFLGGLLAARMIGRAPIGPQPYDMREKNMAC